MNQSKNDRRDKHTKLNKINTVEKTSTSESKFFMFVQQIEDTMYIENINKSKNILIK